MFIINGVGLNRRVAGMLSARAIDRDDCWRMGRIIDRIGPGLAFGELALLDGAAPVRPM